MKKHFDLQASKDCTSCSKCYKCVKSCPVNAIKIKDDDVYELDERCIDCGKCFSVCHKEVHMKALDFESFREYIADNDVIVLLDTTYFMSVEPIKINQIEEALTLAGFKSVETAFDGLAVHDYLVDHYYAKNEKFVFNTNCIPFLKFVKKYAPNLIDKILPYKTATEISAMMKREKYGDKTKILLVSNCFGDYDFTKDNGVVDRVVLASELSDFLNWLGINMYDIPPKEGKRAEFKFQHFSTIAPSVVSGMTSCANVIDYVSKVEPATAAPLRFFVCPGGCFNSKVLIGAKKPFEREQIYLKFLESNFDFTYTTTDKIEELGDLNRFRENYISEAVDLIAHQQSCIDDILNGLGIEPEMPEYDCNSCGYGSCSEFALAVLDDRANFRQCASHINRINIEQATSMSKMIDELNEAFSLTIPDNRLEKTLKNTPIYVGAYDPNTDYLEVTDIIDEGLYIHIINCLKIAADLKDCNLFDMIGLDKNVLVQSILYHCNAKTQPILSKGAVVKYGECFEDKKLEARRSAIFAREYYKVPEDVYNIIKYHKHEEFEIGKDFPKYLIFGYRLFKIIDTTSSVLTKTNEKITVSFEFINFILKVNLEKDEKTSQYIIDLYKTQDFKAYEDFLKR